METKKLLPVKIRVENLQSSKVFSTRSFTSEQWSRYTPLPEANSSHLKMDGQGGFPFFQDPCVTDYVWLGVVSCHKIWICWTWFMWKTMVRYHKIIKVGRKYVLLRSNHPRSSSKWRWPINRPPNLWLGIWQCIHVNLWKCFHPVKPHDCVLLTRG